ncbi:class I lanthipeptide [Parafilimonas sp.]|uniref:class I lanthipeptide n=1 Tax=Parafilimonas sp. TaxID=1969739 RepID=UPI0039E40F2A
MRNSKIQKLFLKKSTLSRLTDDQLLKVKGGGANSQEPILSIGSECSCNHTCSRKKGDTCCCPPVNT